MEERTFFLSDKVSGKDEIRLRENTKLVKTDIETSDVLNNFFSNIVQNLDISRYSNDKPYVNYINDSNLKALLKNRKHPTIVTIRKRYKNKDSFSFLEVKKKEIEMEILNLDANKASQKSDIPIKVVKDNVDIICDFVCASFNSSVKTAKFHGNLNPADITPLYKKGQKDIKGNYRPMSILLNFSKISEKCIFKQISHFLKYQCGSRKGFSAQHCLLAMLKKWKRSIDNGKTFSALMTGISKAFYSLGHKLLIAKVNAHGFSLTALKPIHDYLSNRKQLTKINSSYSSWHEIIFGVNKGQF